MRKARMGSGVVRGGGFENLKGEPERREVVWGGKKLGFTEVGEGSQVVKVSHKAAGRVARMREGLAGKVNSMVEGV